MIWSSFSPCSTALGLQAHAFEALFLVSDMSLTRILENIDAGQVGTLLEKSLVCGDPRPCPVAKSI
jgi:hypothetical protein